ncbi:MAG TPA: acyl-CoA dehydrogenase family protein [Acidimicrobiia bacterium]|nr:acyl-CoA dehydrogenase family protein [Acidimicrobiia bacterium]
MADDELSDILRAMRAFIDDEVIPAEDVLREGSLASMAAMDRLKDEAKRRGLWALGHPKEIGGGGLGFMAVTHLNEVIGRSFFGQSAVGTWSMQDSIMLNLYATDEQKEKWLYPLVAGDIRSSIGMTEPEVAGSDPTEMQATAVLDGDEWVVNAHKWFTTGASIAAFTTILAITEPNEENRHQRFSAIVVPTDTPGYEVVRTVPTMGSTLGAHCEIRLTDARVPRENLLGERGSGFVLAQRRLGPGRIFHCMRWLGQMQRAFELMCARANERSIRGSLLSQKGQIQQMIAESAADIFSHRAATLAAAEAVDRGSDGRVEISLIKFRGAELLHNVIDRAIQVHGALGVTADTPLEWMYREARYARIYDGPDEVHREVVARKLVRNPQSAPWYTL